MTSGSRPLCKCPWRYPTGGLIASGGADSCIKLWPLSDWVPHPAPSSAGASRGNGPFRGGPAVRRWQLDPPQHLLRPAFQPAAGGCTAAPAQACAADTQNSLHACMVPGQSICGYMSCTIVDSHVPRWIASTAAAVARRASPWP